MAGYQASRPARPLSLCALLVVSGSACSETASSAQPAVLFPLSGLTPTPAADDPLPSHRPAEVDCSPLDGWFLEAGNLEVDSGNCNYLSLSAEAAVTVPRGATVTTEISHFDLTAAQPTEAHLALAVREEIIWETTVPVPSDGQVLPLSINVPQGIDKGDPVALHLHNHGQNTYTFTEVWVSETIDD